jgi:hypothetical protein
MSAANRDGLLRQTPDAYGNQYSAHLLEQYRIYVDSADRISERRTAANNYLIVVNAFLVTLYGLAAALGPSGLALWAVALPIAGVLVCATWWVLIRNYRSLNSVKYQVIHLMEAELPAAPYDLEWQLAEEGKGSTYKPLTHIEQWIPAVFGALYVALLAALIC